MLGPSAGLRLLRLGAHCYPSAVITLESLSCQRAPPLSELNLELRPGELPMVVGSSALEREALVELLAGFRTESSGAVTQDGVPLSPKLRRQAVVVLPRHPALTPELSVVEHLRLVARFKGGKATDAALQQLLTFAGVDRGARRPRDLDADQKLRLTLGLAVAAGPSLVVAHDPPPEVFRLLESLFAAERSVLAVVAAIPEVELRSQQLHGLTQGKLTPGLPAPRSEPGESFFSLKVSAGEAALEALIAAYPGVSADRVGEGQYRVSVQREVALAALMRALVRAGVMVDRLEPVSRRRQT
jgi:ABC-type lipoprotein export system ATPase subunit